jgi:NifU-like protein
MTDIYATVEDHFLRPRNAVDLSEKADVSGEAGSFSCGAIVRLSLQLKADSQKISGAKFKAVGCRHLIAAASVFTEVIAGKTLTEAAALSEEDITARFKDFPPERKRCAALCLEALGVCLARQRDAAATAREEWSGEEALICACFGVSEKTIEDRIRAGKLRAIEEVTDACNAGGGCGSCHSLIEDTLEDYWRTEPARA